MTIACPYCLATTYGSDDQLRRLVHYQAGQLHRLTGGAYVAPNEVKVASEIQPSPSQESTVNQVATVERLLGQEDIFRKPPRVAAPRLLARLADAGFTLEET